jgi:hypothetical protein
MMNKTNLLIDGGILAAFLVAMEPRLTGVPVHEWLALAFTGTILVHLLLHWNWIIQVGRTFFARLLHTSRLKFVVDSLLFVSFLGVMLSGLMISRSVMPFVGISLGRNFIMTRLHAVSASSMLVMVGLHFALSWSWVVGMTRRYILSPIGSIFHAQPHNEPAPVTVEAK